MMVLSPSSKTKGPRLFPRFLARMCGNPLSHEETEAGAPWPPREEPHTARCQPAYPSEVHPVLDEGSGNSDAEIRKRQAEEIVADFTSVLQRHAETHMGYAINQKYDYTRLLVLNEYSINNVGDPFNEGNISIHSRPFEVGVLEWFAKLWEIDRYDYWGYVTTGGTEGIMHGIYVGRENLPDGILYASAEAHHSVFKAARMYRMQHEKIPTLATGEIDYDALRAALEKNKHLPAILNVNIGTTMKGAVDDLDRILDILAETGFTEDRFYIHCDAALFGIMLPFLEREGGPLISFKKPIGSVSVSGHKFLGSPMPCGVVITRKSLVYAVRGEAKLIAPSDLTISCSRGGQAAVYMWYALSTKGYSGLKQEVESCLGNALLLKSALELASIPVELHDQSNAVFFERPKDENFIKKWQLACKEDIAQVIVMPNVDQKKLKTFVLELITPCGASVQDAIESLFATERN